MRLKFIYRVLISGFLMSSCGIFGGDDDGENENPKQNPNKPQLDPNKGKVQFKIGNQNYNLDKKHEVTLKKLLFGAKDISDLSINGNGETGNIIHALHHVFEGEDEYKGIPGISETSTGEEMDNVLAEFFKDLKDAIGEDEFKKLVTDTRTKGETPYNYLKDNYFAGSTRDYNGLSQRTKRGYKAKMIASKSKLLKIIDPDQYN